MDDIATKEKIRDCFNNASKTYDDYCHLQQEICLDCLNLLPTNNNHFDFIADIACGTGISTQYLTRKVNYKICYAVDMAEKLLSLAKEKNITRDLKFILADFDDHLFFTNKLDLVFCNMGLQWSLNIQNTLKSFNSYLNPNGILLFSIPIMGTFPEININHKNALPSLSFIKTILKKAKFNIINHQVKTYIEEFNSPSAALKSIKKIGANHLIASTHPPLFSLSRNNIAKIFSNIHPATLTYNIAFIMAKTQES